MSTRSRAAALVAAALVLACGPAAAAPATTDAYAVAAPDKPWTAAAAFDVAGRRAWTATGDGAGQALLRVDVEGVGEAAADAAIERRLERERAGIRAATDPLPGVDRGPFEADSLTGAAGLRWTGFRVQVRAGDKVGASWRWIALHPAFPSRRIAYVVSYDASAPGGKRPPALEAAARLLAASLTPRGRGLAGGLDEAWLDARAAAFAARIDSAQRLCWSDRADAAPAVARLGLGRGLVPGGDFWLLTDRVAPDSLVDPAAAEYGAAFDRNGDGRPDLLVVNRGVQPFGDGTRQPVVAVAADDDFDGRVDAILVEDGDRDGDGRVDARAIVRDRDGDGLPDEGRAFQGEAAAGSKEGQRLPVANGEVKFRRAVSPGGNIDFVEFLRYGNLRISELARARGTCSL